MAKTKSAERYLIIHGHFYQPPRENPWTEKVEREDSAAPYHDWNERITDECYRPNSVSRILDGLGRIVDIVNNYPLISFNFGPTLLSWLEENEPETYRKITEADRESLLRFSDHGSAVAQAYNHMILPLANRRDQVTQVRWGIADFRHRFGRDPVAMWLPETAVNYPTLEVLIEHGMKFLILSPSQAQAVKPLGKSEDWQDVSDGSIDTTQPYRCFLRDAHGREGRAKYIDIFFYHEALSRAVAFEHLLRDAKAFADRIEAAYLPEAEHPQLVSIATDGESYGHHEPFGDMGLAYLLNVEAPKRSLRVTNYAEFLATHPPTWEVELKDGPNGEGTSWSCSHGVGRWYRDCGCSTGGRPGWNQKWRWHLRRAMDSLRDDLARLFEEEGKRFFADPWAVRDAYIAVILDRSPQNVQAFLSTSARPNLTQDERVLALKLLEMQRHAMLMYTSCGWFFADVSGLETVQVLRYAARAIQLGEALGGRNLEIKFLDELKKAKSNIPYWMDGRRVYEKLVKPTVVGFAKVVNHYAIRAQFKEYQTLDRIYHYRVERLDEERRSKDGRSIMVGRARVASGITLEEREYGYCLLRPAEQEFRCFVKRVTDDPSYDAAKAEILRRWEQGAEDLESFIRERLGAHELGLYDMFFEEREEIVGILIKDKMEELGHLLSDFYEKNFQLILMINRLGIAIPKELRGPAEYTLSARLRREIEASEDVAQASHFKAALQIVKTAERFGFTLNTQAPAKIFQKRLEDRLASLYEHPNLDLCRDVLQLLDISEKLQLKLNQNRLQDRLWLILREKTLPLIDRVVSGEDKSNTYELVNELLRLAYKLNFNIDEYKQRLKPLEQRLSQEPRFWP